LNFFNNIFSKKNTSNKYKSDTIIQEKEVELPSIDPFSYCVFNPYFKCQEDFSKVFSEFEMRLGSLQRYFELNNLHIKNYISH
jgi:hypothetical protein